MNLVHLGVPPVRKAGDNQQEIVLVGRSLVSLEGLILFDRIGALPHTFRRSICDFLINHDIISTLAIDNHLQQCPPPANLSLKTTSTLVLPSI